MAGPAPGRGDALTIAVIGGDGSGKTTVARQLVADSTRPTRYVYLGTGFEAQNIALPTTRLLARLKTRAYRKQLDNAPQQRPTSAHDVHRWTVRRGPLAAAAITAHRMADQTYRSLAVWLLRRRGYDVVCDRHFLFEYAQQLLKEDRGRKPRAERLHLWFVETVCPRPDLFVFLDAPPDVLVNRKPERSLDEQRRYRAAVSTLGSTLSSFMVVDGTASPPEVAAAIARLMADYRAR
ncbi:MAG: hypothetical protein AAFN30_14715 [Actinomycetota bacterium]